MYDGIRGSNIPQELVAQSFPFACSLHETRDVNNFNRSRQNILWLHELCKLI
jgi:hypothetical protein